MEERVDRGKCLGQHIGRTSHTELERLAERHWKGTRGDALQALGAPPAARCHECFAGHQQVPCCLTDSSS